MTDKTRTFDTGATRDSEEGKLDYEGFLSPLVLQRYAEYLHKHREQSDGKMRDGDNWQQGMPLPVYMKSALRHVMSWWIAHRRPSACSLEDKEDTICAVIFNASGYLHELLESQDES